MSLRQLGAADQLLPTGGGLAEPTFLPDWPVQFLDTEESGLLTSCQADETKSDQGGSAMSEANISRRTVLRGALQLP